jgi:hypothetical protein
MKNNYKNYLKCYTCGKKTKSCKTYIEVICERCDTILELCDGNTATLKNLAKLLDDV